MVRAYLAVKPRRTRGSTPFARRAIWQIELVSSFHKSLWVKEMGLEFMTLRL